jgi:nucleotidyltransferase/DNA polymerase involved in DNA repair
VGAIKRFLPRECIVEKASIDECYIDVTFEAQRRLKALNFWEDILPAARSFVAGDDDDDECVRTKAEIRAGLSIARHHQPTGHGGGGVDDKDDDGDDGNDDDGGKEEAEEGEDKEEEEEEREEKCGENVSVRPNCSAQSPQQQQIQLEPSTEPQWFRRGKVLWTYGERLLAAGAAVTYDVRRVILREVGFTSSGGIGYNKMLAKLCSGMHKPARQTVCVPEVVPQLMARLPVTRLRGFGGTLGEKLMKVSHVR